MFKKLSVFIFIIGFSNSVMAQNSTISGWGNWHYNDASKQETDEGLNFCIKFDAETQAKNKLLAKTEGWVCATNIEETAQVLQIQAKNPKHTCAYRAKGKAILSVVNLKILPPDAMNDGERLEAKLVSIKDNQTTIPLYEKCGYASSDEESSFNDIKGAIEALRYHATYNDLFPNNYTDMFEEKGLAKIGAAEYSFFVPKNSKNILVIYQDGNSAIHQLKVYEFQGSSWDDISEYVLPNYLYDIPRFRGTNYILEYDGNNVKIQDLPNKRVFIYAGSSFVLKK